MKEATTESTRSGFAGGARVPENAERDAALEGWVVCGRDEGGQRHGRFVLYREDGSLSLEGCFEHGARVGVFTGYHPNGDVASRGTYDADKLEGTFVKFASDTPGAVPLRGCCVPSGARELRLEYTQGRCSGERFFDALGRALRSNGRLLPDRPSGLPPEADFEEGTEHWVVRSEATNGAILRRCYASSGKLVEEVELVSGRKVAMRLFGEDERLREVRHFDAEGRLHGPYEKRHEPGEAPYQDPAIDEERGGFDHGQPVGTWLFGTGGSTLRVVERGVALPKTRVAELVNESLAEVGEEELEARVLDRLAARDTREALWFAARAAGRAGDARSIQRVLTKSVVPVAAKQLAAWSELLERSKKLDVETVLNALLSGAEASEALRVLATLMPESSSAALDFAEAALLLAPGSKRCTLTRALIRIERGDVEGARADAANLNDAIGARTLVETTLNVLFTPRTFTIDGGATAANPELPKIGIEQSLESVKWAVQLYATRLRYSRERVYRHLHGAEPSWLPPDLSQLLPDGPIELRRFTAKIEDEADEGTETSDVEVDEGMELEQASVRGSMRVARADWDALCWLCWSVGLDEVTLPTEIAPRDAFATVVNEAILRCWRAHDQLRTAGLTARVRGIPGFSWEGQDIATLPRSLAEVAALELRERRAMFFFLMFPQNVSPFQADLRKV